MKKARKKKPARAGNLQKSQERLSLRKLVAKITNENRYPEIPTGPARGREIVEWLDLPEES